MYRSMAISISMLIHITESNGEHMLSGANKSNDLHLQRFAKQFQIGKKRRRLNEWSVFLVMYLLYVQMAMVSRPRHENKSKLLQA